MGVVPLLIFLHKASINTFLDLALDFFNLFLWSGIGTTPHSRLSNSGFSFRFIWSGFLQERGGGKAPNTSSQVSSSFFSRGSRLRL